MALLVEPGTAVAYLDGPVWGARRVEPRPTLALLVAGASDLPGARQELDSLRELFPKSRTWSLGDEYATLKALASHYPVLHIATHGGSPQRDGGQRLGGQLRGSSGTLSAFRLADLGLPAGSLAVISACESGQDAGSGRDNSSLISALRTAGAAVAVGSPWPLDDRSAPGLFLDFYRQLAKDGDPAAALARAQSAMKASHPHPFYWAGPRVVTGL